jgi:hypothetical protein
LSSPGFGDSPVCSRRDNQLSLMKELFMSPASVSFGTDQSKNEFCELITSMFTGKLPSSGSGEQ